MAWSRQPSTAGPRSICAAAIAVAFARADVDAVEVLDVCTVESEDHYSHRRDGLTGRHGVVVALR